MYPFQVSVIMAVYNVAPYLPEAIDSVIAQNIGFSNIQLILVDDGSTDGSGAICDDYAARYPENILAIHKENGGVCSARNEGVKYAKGKYLNFMDADDTLSDNVCTKVVEFFEKHYEDVDVVAFPMFFFDGKTGPHILNNKFSKGSRVIDLRKDYDLVQLSTASSFLKAETLQQLNLRYDQRLHFTEDAKLLVPLLMQTMRLGVVSTCRYRVRRRSGGNLSATQHSGARAQWWLDTLKYFQLDTIEYCLNTLGFVPRYVQYLLAYDLQWRLQQPALPRNLLSEDEIAQFREALSQVLSHIDDQIIWKQKQIWREHKIHALTLKYGAPPEIIRTLENIQFYYGENEVFSLMDHGLNLSFLSIGGGICRVDGFLMLCTQALTDLKLEVHDQFGNVYPCTPAPGPKVTRILDEDAQFCQGFSVDIPHPDQGALELTFHGVSGRSSVRFHQFRFGKYFPLTQKLTESYYYKDSVCVQPGKGMLTLTPCGRIGHAKRELRLLRELLRGRQVGARKAVIARILAHILELMKRKPLVLISDRITRGGDNGEAMFRHIRRHHRKEVHAVFVVGRTSPDYRALKQVGPVVANQSWLHKLLHLICDWNLSSSAEIHTVNPFAGYESSYQDLLTRAKFVFLQHGITKDDISGWINRYEKNIRGLVCAANAEHDAFLDSRYGYGPEHIWLTGFPRFDRLYQQEQKRIAVVPTWRKDLMGALNPQTGLWSMAPGFEESAFLRFYRDLLNHPRLQDALRQFGYTLQFFPHPNFLGVLDAFQAPESVEILDGSTQYRDLYAHADLILTDYSSAVFDFAYLRKPVLYCQFDADTFFSGTHSYEKGYFDYHRDGFGEVAENLEQTVDLLIAYMASGCRLKEEYRRRIDAFFAFRDQGNCERVFRKIMEPEA